jgi:hypothetical protein
MRHIPRIAIALAVFAAGTTLAASAHAQTTAAAVAGTWNMALQGDHVVRAALHLTQQDAKVSGRLMLMGTEVPVDGEFATGALKWTAERLRERTPRGAAAARQSEPATVDGTWNVSLIADHVVPVALVLQQEGTVVTGTVIIHGTDVPVTGDYTRGTLKLTASTEGADGTAHPFGAMTITATMKDDGTLAGEMVSSRGIIPLTAERLKKRG